MSVAQRVATLSRVESSRLRSCEQTIERGLGTFVEVGEALAEIRDARLYRSEFDRFEDYCRDRWNLSKRYANNLVEASRVAGAIAPTGVSPTNEAQARELAPLLADPPALTRVVKQALRQTGTGTLPTAQILRTLAAPEIDRLTEARDEEREQQDWVESLGPSADPDGDRRRQLAARLALGIVNACDRLRAEFTVTEWKRYGPAYIRKFTPDVATDLCAAADLVTRIASPFEETE